MDQMLVWTFIHREVLRTRAKRRPVDIIDIYEDNLSTLGLFRLLEWARTRRASGKSTCDSGQQEKVLAGEGNGFPDMKPFFYRNVP